MYICRIQIYENGYGYRYTLDFGVGTSQYVCFMASGFDSPMGLGLRHEGLQALH